MTTTQPEAPGELLYGVANIATRLGMTKRQAYHLHQKGEIPTFNVGRKVAARRTSLDQWAAEREAAGRAKTNPEGNTHA